MNFRSPWASASPKRYPALKQSGMTDIVIVGAGISGVATLYFLLKHTRKQIVLLEKNTIASGATGHNAGLAIAHIERPLDELIADIGLAAIQQEYEAIEAGWDELIRIHHEIGIPDNLVFFETGAIGFQSLESFAEYLKMNHELKKMNHPKWRFYLADDAAYHAQIETDLQPEIAYVPREQIQIALNTHDVSYLGMAVHLTPIRAGRMDGVKFCYRLLEFLTEHYAERFQVYEHTKVDTVVCGQGVHHLHCAEGVLQAAQVILCTNGYTHFQMIDSTSQREYSFLRDNIIPREGYLAAYAGTSTVANGNAFFRDDDFYPDVPYWYLSQSPDPAHAGQSLNLIGGPEFIFPEPTPADFRARNTEKSLLLFQQFLKQTYDIAPDYTYFWRGVMGYTHSGLRLVAEDAHYTGLWYNVGCNGIGIVPAITAGQAIAARFSG